MTTVTSNNVFNIAIDGTFDDCQNIVKKIFVSDDIKKITTLSAINSINWARIASQSVYFFWAYLQASQFNKKVNFIIPTGNFGNVYAAHTAGILGLPINKLYVATNSNDIMHRTITNGDMSLKLDLARECKLTPILCIGESNDEKQQNKTKDIAKWYDKFSKTQENEGIN